MSLSVISPVEVSYQVKVTAMLSERSGWKRMRFVPSLPWLPVEALVPPKRNSREEEETSVHVWRDAVTACRVPAGPPAGLTKKITEGGLHLISAPVPRVPPR